MNYLDISELDELEFLSDALLLDKEAFGESLEVSDTQKNNDFEYLRLDGKIQLNPFYHSEYFKAWLKQNLRAKRKEKTARGLKLLSM